MKKFYFLLFLSLLTFEDSFASHTKGGWMYYEYLGPGISDPTKLRYRIGFNLYMVCDPNPAQIDDPINFSIFDGGTPFTFLQDVPVTIKTNTNTQNCTQQSCYPCLNLIPFICYKVINYETIVELAPSARGYIISKQRCCRIIGLSNLTAPSDAIGATYTIKIPGTVAGVPDAHINKSPRFIFNDTSIVCGNSYFSINFTATDADGDSLVYSFCDAFTGATAAAPNPNTASAPPYATVSYQAPFNGTQQLGSLANINPVTGVISGTAPAAGEYVLSVCVAEYRNGVRFADSRKELHLKVADCFPVNATLDPNFTTCGDLNLAFQNLTDNPSILNWFWVFGDPASGSNDTSFLQMPNHTFSTAGTYTVKLVVNRGLPCIDSAYQVVNVFPGFFPGFRGNAPFCVGQPVSFSDTTRTNYGTVTGWQWDFGDPATLADTSRLQHPSYTYTSPGNYTISLSVANTKGCRETITRQVTVFANPIVSVFPSDTTYCALDSVRLTATGTGSYNWLPASNISFGNTANPLVYPPVATVYHAILTDANGCRARDSVRVNPINDLSNAITANPATICQEDTLTLTGTSNHNTNVSWSWSPAATLESPTSAITRAWPGVTGNYTLITRWGNNCIATKTINIPVKPLAIPNAGPDKDFCMGQGSAQLTASGGDNYTWSPATGLSSTTIANPVASPPVTTKYAVSVGVTGCSKRRIDSVLVTVRAKPDLQVTNDTLICAIDNLPLFANGNGNVLWSPNYMINDITSHTPVVGPDVPTLYRVRLTDNFGCYSDDSVFVDVKQVVTIDAGPDTTLCKSDGFALRTTSDAISYTWSPDLYLSSNSVKNPVATPDTTITYTVIGNIGQCQASSQVTITVVPAPVAFAGADTTICMGFSTQLKASGGSHYTWNPTSFLSDPFIANPLVMQPTRSTEYIVTVTDTLGCPRPVYDTMRLTVIPRLHVNAGPPDTSVVDGQPLQLLATGAFSYLWNPPTWLNSTTIASPVSIPRDSITYYVTGTDQNGCTGTDSIHVRFFTMESDMYVPTAFTPGNDGLNDLARPIMLGMRSLTYFRIYNRFGEKVFETSQIGKGWNGIYKGKPQDTATFVWMAQGITFKGQVKTKKGFIVLIR